MTDDKRHSRASLVHLAIVVVVVVSMDEWRVGLMINLVSIALRQPGKSNPGEVQ
jgi:hypothetical protein